MRIRLRNELLLLNVLTILLIIIITVIPSNILRIVLGLPFLLFFPGYTLIAALFPRRDALDSVERVALSFGLSMAVVILLSVSSYKVTPFSSACNQEDGWFYQRKKVDPLVILSTDAGVVRYH